MLRNQITGAKYRSENTGQMTNLNIATPADSNDTNFSSSDILLAKDTVKIIDDKIANKKSFKFVETLPNKIEDVDPDVIYIVTGNNTNMENVEIINTQLYSVAGTHNDKYYEYVFLKYKNGRLYYEQLGKSNELPLIKGNNETSVTTIRSTANGEYSTALGIGCTTNNLGECAVGQFNMSTGSDDPSKQTLFSIGNGSNQQKRNIFEVKANGDVYMSASYIDPNVTEPFILQQLLVMITSSIDSLVKQVESLEERVSTLENK